MFEFKVLTKQKNARTGEFTTPHGKLLTPELAFVATDAEIRGVPNEDLNKLPINLTISNTFHTYTKNLVPKIENVGGLNRYMKYDNVTMTDSGGFQVFSLGFGKTHGVGKISSMFPGENREEKGLLIVRDRDNLLHITDEGVMFNYDETFFMFTPEMSINIQKRLGADITFAFDECTSPLNSYDYTKQAMERTHKWLIRCIHEHNKPRQTPPQALFGVVQGGYYKDLREESARFCASQNVPGFGIGGSLGRDKKDMLNILMWVNAILPEEKPRHLFGIGQVRDILTSVERGVDLFDCVIPTREARHKVLYTKKGKVNLRKMKNVDETIDNNCFCEACQEKITMKQLYELFLLKNPRAFYFATVHNIQFFSDLMKEIRETIKKNSLTTLKERYFQYY